MQDTNVTEGQRSRGKSMKDKREANWRRTGGGSLKQLSDDDLKKSDFRGKGMRHRRLDWLR